MKGKIACLISGMLLCSNLYFSVMAEVVEVPYLVKAAVPNFPIYVLAEETSDCTGFIESEGVFTIVEEAIDGNGEIWGRLKSGAGWINLTDLKEIEERPMKAEFVLSNPEDTLKVEQPGYQKFIAEDSEYISWIFLKTEEVLKNVTLELLEYEFEAGAYGVSEVLYEQEEMTAETPLFAGVVYWGDMTTYGISFTDEEEKEYHYALYMSGMDGSLIMEEYEPLEIMEQS